MSAATATEVRCDSCYRRTTALEGERQASGGIVCGACLLVCAPGPGVSAALSRQTEDGLSPREFQSAGIEWMSRRRRGLIADEMGVGKTMEAIIGAFRLDCPNVVVVPSSLKMTWAREIIRWRPELNYVIVNSGDLWSRSFSVLQPGWVMITSYGLLPGDVCLGCKSREIEACAHFGPETPYPEWVKEGGRYVPYRLPPGKTSKIRREKMEEIVRGEASVLAGKRWASNPMPSVTRPYVLVGDEIHAIKNPESDRGLRWRELASRIIAADGYVWGMSGTPVENHPEEYWDVLDGLGLAKAAFGSKALWKVLFSDWYKNKKGNRVAPTGADLAEIQVRLSRVRLRRRTDEVLPDLPPVRYQRIDVEISAKRLSEVNAAVQRMLATRRAWADVGSGVLLDPWEEGIEDSEAERRRSLYAESVDRYVPLVKQTDDEIVDAINEVTAASSQHPGIDTMSRVRRLLSMAKIEAVEAWVRSCEAEGQPVVLFCQHVDVIKRFGDRPGWAPFHGGIPDDVRDRTVVDFQSGEIPAGIAVSLGAGREGITLTRARIGGFVDLNWNPARNRQAVARLRRLGSEHHDSILIVRFVANHPLDELVLSTLEEKERLLDALDGLKPIFRDEGESE